MTLQAALGIIAIVVSSFALSTSITAWHFSRINAQKARVSAMEAERHAATVEKALEKIIATRREIQRLRGEKPT